MEIAKKEILKNVLLEKNTTFLFGAGASAPFFSSLGNFEQILSETNLTKNGKNLIKTLFYKVSISDNLYLLNYLNGYCYCGEKTKLMLSILNEYTRFIHNILEFLKTRNSRVSPKRVNIITTNYDLFLESAIETSLEHNARIFFNDGANGYVKRILNTDNFNKTLLYSGVFDNYSSEMPVINLIKCHGSVNWREYLKNKKGRSKIQITSSLSTIKDINQLLSNFWNKFETDIENYMILANQEFSSPSEFIDLLNNRKINLKELIDDINEIANYSEHELNELVSLIEKLQIVLPTKKKFQTTLIEEHYFNMLRLLSYELEKEQSALIVFGFSFYDEHIADVVQRSLNNPNLIVIVICYRNDNKEEIISTFNFSSHSIPTNIVFIEPDDFLINEIDKDDFEEQEDFDKSQYTIVELDESVKIYSREVQLIKEESHDIPVLNFHSFNMCLEEDLLNNYQPSHSFEVGE